MTSEGSDCPTGKEQFSDQGARDKVRAMQAQGFRVKKYRCLHCGLHHVGHRRRADKRNEMTRRR